MYKKVRSVLVIFTILILGVTAIPVFAQEGTPESGGPSAEMISHGSDGTGLVPEGSAGVVAERNIPPIESLHPESVIGPDGRVKINVTTNNPNRKIVYMIMTFPSAAQYTCTGWFIGSNDVATAAHCLYDPTEGGYVTSIIAYPGSNGVTAPFGSTTMNGTNRWVAPGWITNGNPPNDYGVFQTSTNMGDIVGWFGFAWQTSNVFLGTYTVRGHPGDKPAGEMWSMSGKITNASGSRLWYRMDTFGGQSGSPVYRTINNVCCYAFGIHTYGTSYPRTLETAPHVLHKLFSKD